MNIREVIEYFHLSFCHLLGSRMDRRLFCLKGGCNLRFYYQSIRYSEDIDFDVTTVSVATLKKNVEKILDDLTFHALLRHKNIEIGDWSAPKQTETTQRWKIGFKVVGLSGKVPTKIEFSRRTVEIEGASVEPVQPQLVTHYQLQTVLLNHYQLQKALEQKVGALVGRAETQARDVIDLKFIKDQLQGCESLLLSDVEKTKALEALSSISFDDYLAQVWPYLMLEYQEHYGRRETWNQLQGEIFKFIENASRAP